MSGIRRKDQNARVPVVSNIAPEVRIKDIEDAWIADRLKGEVGSTERLLSDDYQGGTSSGHAQTKTDFVASIKAGVCKFKNFRSDERSIRVSGDIALSVGRAVFESSDRQHSFRYLRVFKRYEDGQWHLVASQSTLILPSKP